MGRAVRIRKITLPAAATFCLLFGIHNFAAAAPITLFEDGFENETATGSTLNYASFVNWDVVDGAVDLVRTPSFSIDCVGSTGWCVDLDGTTDTAGRLESKSVFALTPGLIYTLTFDISGNQRVPGTDSVTFGLIADMNEVFSDLVTKSAADPFETISRQISVSSSSNVRLFFDHAGGDQIGLILDNVQLTAVPLPQAAFLFPAGLIAGLAWIRRKAG